MAKRVITLVVKTDDFTNEDIPEGQGETFVFGWDGTEYEIDLNDGNARDIRTFMGKLTEHSRKVGRYRPSISVPRRAVAVSNGGGPKELPATTTRDGDTGKTRAKYQRQAFMKEIRMWARENGFPQQGFTGRLLADVRQAWDEAHPDRPAPSEDTFVK